MMNPKETGGTKNKARLFKITTITGRTIAYACSWTSFIITLCQCSRTTLRVRGSRKPSIGGTSKSLLILPYPLLLRTLEKFLDFARNQERRPYLGNNPKTLASRQLSVLQVNLRGKLRRRRYPSPRWSRSRRRRRATFARSSVCV